MKHIKMVAWLDVHLQGQSVEVIYVLQELYAVAIRETKYAVTHMVSALKRAINVERGTVI